MSPEDSKKKKILITGSSGLVGTALSHFLPTHGHAITKLKRGPEWNPEKNLLNAQVLESQDVIIHLSGEGIASGRWTAEKKREILESRTHSTRLLVSKLNEVTTKPKLFICASAIGIYGDAGDTEVIELSPPGTGFLADVTKAWEDEALKAESLGIRTVLARFGIILSSKGGALGKMLPAFLFGAGGPLGSGNQYMSWISLHDVSRALGHIVDHEELSGPVNIVSPNPCTSNDFAKTLGHVLQRPAFLRIPELVLKMIFGEMAEETMLSSIRAVPQKLLSSGFQFQHAELEEALKFET